jgi:hypothetical protein
MHLLIKTVSDVAPPSEQIKRNQMGIFPGNKDTVEACPPYIEGSGEYTE